jgi:hypothetical protein
MSLLSTEFASAPPSHPIRAHTLFALARIVVGLFLLGTAGLKLYALALDPFGQDSLLGSPRLLIATIEVEIILSVWLLSGWAQRASWLAALAFFGVAACTGLYMALDGQSSCGCFGPVAVSPWLAFGLDASVIAALLIMRPARAEDHPRGSRLQGVYSIALGTAAFLVLIGGAFALAFDDPAAVLA